MDSSPEPAASSGGRPPFIYRRRVEFAETDLAGIVHFSMFFRYMEEAEHALWRAHGLSIVPREAEFGFPRVSATCDFRLPLRFEDEFEVRLLIEDVSSRTIRYRAEIVRGRDTVATGSMVMACVRKTAEGTMKAVELPGFVRQALGL